MSTNTHANAQSPGYRWGGFAFVLCVGAIVTALAFEHLGGVVPCPLCLQQRYAYYAGIPLFFAGLVFLSADMGRWAGVVFFTMAIAFLANAGLGVYQAGAEWGYWPGPASCAGGGELKPLGLGASLADSQPVVSCTDAAVRILGLSFAGWNVVASMVIHIASLKAAAASLNKS